MNSSTAAPLIWTFSFATGPPPACCPQIGLAVVQRCPHIMFGLGQCVSSLALNKACMWATYSLGVQWLWTVAASNSRKNIALNVEQSNLGVSLHLRCIHLCVSFGIPPLLAGTQILTVWPQYSRQNPPEDGGITIQPWRSRLLTAYQVCWSPFLPTLPGRRLPLTSTELTSLRRSSLPARNTLLSIFSPSLTMPMQVPALSSVTTIMSLFTDSSGHHVTFQIL